MGFWVGWEDKNRRKMRSNHCVKEGQGRGGDKVGLF